MLIEIDSDTSSLWKHLRSLFTQIQTLSHQIKDAESATGTSWAIYQTLLSLDKVLGYWHEGGAQMSTDFLSILTWNGITYNSLSIWWIFINQANEVWACNHLWVLPKFQGHQKWFRPWIVMKGENFRKLSTWVGNYNPSHLSCPWTDLIKVRPQTSMDRSPWAWSKLTNVLNHPSQSYFLPNPSPHTQKSANFTVWGTIHHISHQVLQLSRPNKVYRHKRWNPLKLLLNLRDHTTTSHKVIPRYITPTLKKAGLHCEGEVHHISH